MSGKKSNVRSPVKRQAAERYILLSLISFAASVILTRMFLSLTGYPKIGTGNLHIAHVLWGGLLLFVASLLPLILANRWALNLSAILSGVGVGLFIDEVGKFITQTNDYFYPPAAPIIYAFFLLTMLLYLHIKRPTSQDPRDMMYRVLEDLTEILDSDLQLQERQSIETRLQSISRSSNDLNLNEMVNALNHYLTDEQLTIFPYRATFFQRIGQKISPIFIRLVTKRRLQIFLSALLIGMGILALFDFAKLLVYLPEPAHAFDLLLTPLITHGQLHSAQEAIWYLIRTILEGGCGLFLTISGGLLLMGREKTALWLSTTVLVIWIAVINLLVFYFDQFGAVALTLFQFFVLTLIIYYRRAFQAQD